MTSFEINCPQTFHDCDRLDIFPEHKTTHTEFHLMQQGKPLSVIIRSPNDYWSNLSGKTLTMEELAFVKKQIEGNLG